MILVVLIVCTENDVPGISGIIVDFLALIQSLPLFRYSFELEIFT